MHRPPMPPYSDAEVSKAKAKGLKFLDLLKTSAKGEMPNIAEAHRRAVKFVRAISDCEREIIDWWFDRLARYAAETSCSCSDCRSRAFNASAVMLLWDSLATTGARRPAATSAQPKARRNVCRSAH